MADPSPSPLAADVIGLGLWTPGYAGAHAWVERDRNPDIDAPDASLIPRRHRRRATLLSRMAAHCLVQTCADAEIDPATVRTVYASLLGEIETAATLLEMMVRTGLLSPTRFQTSVHNAASGVLSIATGNTGFTTTVSAGDELVAMALIEAMTVVESTGDETVLILMEETWPSFMRHEEFAPLAVALALAPGGDRTAGRTRGRLEDVRRVPAAESPPSYDPGEGLRGNPVSPALSIVDALRTDARVTVRAQRERPDGSQDIDALWCVDVAPPPSGLP